MNSGAVDNQGLPCKVIDVEPEPPDETGCTGFYRVATSRWLPSSLTGFVSNQFALAGRKVACIEPLATSLMRRYVRDQDFDSAQWMINGGMVLNSWHGELVRQAVVNGDDNMLVLLLKNSEPSGSLFSEVLDISPGALTRLVENDQLRLTGDHYHLVVKAASRGLLEVVRGLIAGGAPAFCPGETTPCTSALLAAASRGDHGLVKYLAEAGALKSLLTNWFVQTSPSAVRTLLEIHQLKLNTDYHPLVVGAAARGDLGMLKLLIASGVPASCKGEDYAQSALLNAYIFGHHDVMKFLSTSQGVSRSPLDWFSYLINHQEREDFVGRLKESMAVESD